MQGKFCLSWDAKTIRIPPDTYFILTQSWWGFQRYCLKFMWCGANRQDKIYSRDWLDWTVPYMPGYIYAKFVSVFRDSNLLVSDFQFS